MVSKFSPPLIDVLPCVQFKYSIGDTILEYVPSEKDLRITVNRSLNFTGRVNSLYVKANQRFCLLKRTCHFIDNINKRRVVY